MTETTDTATVHGPATGVHCGPVTDTDGPWSAYCNCHRCHGYALTACLNGHDIRTADTRYRVTVTRYDGRSMTAWTETTDDGHAVMSRSGVRRATMVDEWHDDAPVSMMVRDRRRTS